MKRVIVFATNDYEDTPYRAWFGASEVEFLFLASKAFYDGYQQHGRTLEIEQGQESFDDALLPVLKSFGADAVYARNERDVLPAALLREALGISGQSVSSAEAYRNKFRMKTYIAPSGVSLARYTVLTSIADVRCIHFPMPWVFKPLDDSGSGGVVVIGDDVDLAQWKSTAPKFPLLAEAFVSGSMFHVDGLARNGQVVWSHAGAYVQGCLAFKDDTYAGSYTLASPSPLVERLKEEVKVVIKALPAAGIHTFHAEFFVGADGKPVFCEVGSRTPGGRIKQFVHVATGVDLDKVCLSWILRPDVVPALPAASQPTGWILVYPKKGRLAAIKPGLVHPAVCEERMHGSVGLTYQGGQKSGRGLWSCVFVASTHDALKDFADEIYHNFTAKTVWQSQNARVLADMESTRAGDVLASLG